VALKEMDLSLEEPMNNWMAAKEREILEAFRERGAERIVRILGQ
jgi:hypothetical protein